MARSTDVPCGAVNALGTHWDFEPIRENARSLGPRSVPGQTEENSVSANVFWINPDSGHSKIQSALRICAMCGRLRVGKDFFHVCSIGRCSHVFGLLMRRPLAIMPSADQVPVNNTHSTMRWHKWVVLIAGSTGSALRAVRPPNLHITPDIRRDPVYRASAMGSL
jgi:hypothetical protein